MLGRCAVPIPARIQDARGMERHGTARVSVPWAKYCFTMTWQATDSCAVPAPKFIVYVLRVNAREIAIFMPFVLPLQCDPPGACCIRIVARGGDLTDL